MRALTSLCLVVSLLAAVLLEPAVASAQDEEAPPIASEPRSIRADTSPDDELAAIDDQSAWATGLYVTAITLHVAGLAGGVGFALSGLCVGGCTDHARDMQTGSVISFVFAGIGLLTFVPAIVLDVDSGSRRRRWREQNGTQPTASLRIGPGGLALVGTF